MRRIKKTKEIKDMAIAKKAEMATVMVMEEGPKRQAYILKRGAYDAHGEPVEAATPASLPPMTRPSDAGTTVTTL